MKNKYQLTFGGDPEFFASKDGNCYPPVLFRLKDNIQPIDMFRKESGFPHYIYRRENGITLMDDGAAFELTVPPVDFTEPLKLYYYFQEGYSWGKELFAKVNADFVPKPSINFDITKYPEEYYEQIEEMCVFGCDADFDANMGEFISEKFDVSDYPLRHAGGHFVVGTKDNDLLQSFHDYVRPITQLFSLTVGNIALINSPFPEEEIQRQTYYGKPARYRTPNYGIEYRSPSVSWTMNKSLYEQMFLSAQKAIELFLNPEVGMKVLDEFLHPFVEAYKKVNIKTLSEIYNFVMER